MSDGETQKYTVHSGGVKGRNSLQKKTAEDIANSVSGIKTLTCTTLVGWNLFHPSLYTSTGSEGTDSCPEDVRT